MVGCEASCWGTIGRWSVLLVLMAGALTPLAQAQQAISAGTYFDEFGNARGLDAELFYRNLRDPVFRQRALEFRVEPVQAGVVMPSLGTLGQPGSGFGSAGRQLGFASGLGLSLYPSRGSGGGGMLGGRRGGGRDRSPGYRLYEPIEALDQFYGGFGIHRAGRGRLSLNSILRRRPSLFAASAFDAPVRRVSMRLGNLPRGADLAGPVLFLEESTEPQEPLPSLSERMDSRMSALFQRAMYRGWVLFGNDKYHLAARSFGSASTLIPGHPEARIGEVFCYVSKGSFRSAISALQSFAARDVNPFLHRVPIRSRYGSPEYADAVQTMVGAFTQRAETVDRVALHVFVLWYLDKREEAIARSGTLSGGDPDSPFRNWPGLMRDAKAALSAAPPAP